MHALALNLQLQTKCNTQTDSFEKRYRKLEDLKRSLDTAIFRTSIRPKSESGTCAEAKTCLAVQGSTNDGSVRAWSTRFCSCNPGSEIPAKENNCQITMGGNVHVCGMKLQLL